MIEYVILLVLLGITLFSVNQLQNTQAKLRELKERGDHLSWRVRVMMDQAIDLNTVSISVPRTEVAEVSRALKIYDTALEPASTTVGM